MVCASRIPLLVASFFIVDALGVALAQDYPNRPITMVVANTAGQISDVFTRVITAEMSKYLNQPIVVENRPGGNQTIGVEHVAKNKPADGYTIVSMSVDNMALFPATVKSLRFDPQKDLVPVIEMMEGRLVFGSPPNAPWKTFDELVAYAKANPGKLNYGAASNIIRFPVEIVLRKAGLNIVHVPYNGAGPYMTAILAGDQIQMGMMTSSQGLQLGDKYRILAITGDKRDERFPDVPTFAELGFPELTSPVYSLYVRAGTPQAIQDKLFAAAKYALEQPPVKEHMAKNFLEIVSRPPEAAKKTLARLTDSYADIANQLGIKPE